MVLLYILWQKLSYIVKKFVPTDKNTSIMNMTIHNSTDYINIILK